jgi:hypothetical protein
MVDRKKRKRKKKGKDLAGEVGEEARDSCSC